MYVIYVNYGRGVTLRTGLVELRHRVGVWAHFYVRAHPQACSCIRCFRRVFAGPVAGIPIGLHFARMYPVSPKAT